MPQKDDFLSRLQAQLNETLERAREFSAEGRSGEALTVVRAAQRNILGLEPVLLNRLSSADLLSLLGSGGVPDTERTLGAAELLSAEFEVLTLQGEADPAQAQKALELYLTVLVAEPGFTPFYIARLDTLTRNLDYPALSHVYPALTEVYRAAGRFAEAENWLYRWREFAPDAAQGWAEAFYRELLRLPDEVLAAGGLPRDEVEEGLADVTRRVST